MKFNLTGVILLLVCSSLYPVSAFAQQEQDDRLWYTQAAEKWTDALPLGNSRIGAMVFGGLSKDRIQFNEETLWTGAPREYDHPGAAAALPEIRRLLFEDKQIAAEQLADEKFMGLESAAGDKVGWIKEMRALKGMKGNPALANYDDSGWKTINVPAYEGWETVGLDGLDGAVWFRTSFILPDNYQGTDLVLDLNKIWNEDFTYVNGQLVGTTNSISSRKYTVSAKLLKKGKNIISIQVLNYFDRGGIAGYKDTTKHIAIYPAGDKGIKPLSLNGQWKYKIQNDAAPAVPHFQADYQPFGDLVLDFGNIDRATNYRRELNLSTAVAKTTYNLDGADYTREYFISKPQQAMVIRLLTNKPGGISCSATLGSPHKETKLIQINANTIGMSVQVKDGALKGFSYLTAVLPNGKAVVKDGRLMISGATSVTFYLTAATNFVDYEDTSGNPEKRCRKVIAELKDKTFEQVKKAHIAEYQNYYNTFSIHLGKNENAGIPTNIRLARFYEGHDPSFAGLYVQYGRYLLISSSRPGTQPANLQGIWNDLLSPPWGSKYTTNINAEMNYWPSEVLNLSPMHEPMFNMIAELAKRGTNTAQVHYNAAGWVLHHNTDIWRGTAPINSATHGIWVSGAAWLTLDLWEHYQFTQDRQFLKEKAYPLMRSAAEFFVDFLIKDPKTGWLISTPSNSPENGGLVAGPTMDHQIIRTLFKNCITAASILHTDTAFVSLLQEKYKQIAPNQIGRHGQLQEWLEDKDDIENKHRHVSHLWGVHPGDDITWEQHPELMKAARQSLIYRGDEGTGWSLAWKINFWSRFKDGDHAMKLVKMLISPAETGGGAYLNLFDAHPPFQIDGNFGGAAGIAEMVLQSHTRFIDLLPALPTEIPDGEVTGICARGGFVLSIKWSHNELQSVEVLSNAGRNCVLRYKGHIIDLPTEVGKSYKFNRELIQL